MFNVQFGKPLLKCRVEFDFSLSHMNSLSENESANEIIRIKRPDGTRDWLFLYFLPIKSPYGR